MISETVKASIIAACLTRYKKYPPDRIARVMLQGWAFRGQTGEDYQVDVNVIIKIVTDARKGVVK